MREPVRALGVTRLAVFGLFCGEIHAARDVDLLVQFAPGANPTTGSSPSPSCLKRSWADRSNS